MHFVGKKLNKLIHGGDEGRVWSVEVCVTGGGGTIISYYNINTYYNINCIL